MILFALLFAVGVWLLQQQAALPDFNWMCLPALLVPALLLPRVLLLQRICRNVLLLTLACLLGFFYAAWIARQHLSDSLPETWQGKNIEVVGVVAELPRLHEYGLSFTFDVEKVLSLDARVPQHIMLSTYQSRHAEPLLLHAGERWRLELRLKQPHSTSNPYGFDFEGWMLERGLRASGYVHNKGVNLRLDELVEKPGYLIERLREAIRRHFQQALGDAPYAGVLIALAIGDQGSIPSSQWQLFTRTGVNHLMSISGLHITILAGLAFTLVYAAWKRSVRLTLRLPARKAAAIIGLLVALAYTLLSGFSVPAQRTVYMLGTVAIALLLSRSVAASQILATALLVVLLIDPWAVLSPGFWLSFGAVALILYVSANRLGRPHWLIEYGRVQWAMMIGLIPPLLAMFQQVSLVSPIANAFAIPLVSFVVVPLTLLGALIPFDWILQLAHQALSLCMYALEWLNRLPDAVWTQHAPPAWSIALGMFGVLWCLLPRGFPARWLGLLVMLPMFLILPEAPAQGTLRMVVFDVGQGLAVVAQTHEHALLYDTGPDFLGAADSGNRILIPALRGMGIAHLDVLMLTHNDTDHTGGALSIIKTIPIDLLSSSLPADSPILQQSLAKRRCTDSKSWDWDGVHFELLHPTNASYADSKISKNDRSCTLRISVGQYSVLLTADIEKKSERELLQRHPDKLPSTLLVVPHHGSKTSSTQSFVDAVHPRYAVFTAAYRSRFGHPKPVVVARYRAAGSLLLRSDRDGAIVVEMSSENFSIERYRKTHAKYWTHTVPN